MTLSKNNSLKKYFFICVFGVISLVVVFLLFYFLANSQQQTLTQELQEQGSEQAQVQAKSEHEIWQEQFVDLSQKKYFPAAQRFFLSAQLDTSEIDPKSKHYQLIVGKNDAYSLFCLKQTLHYFDVKYTLINAESSIQIFLDTDNQNLLKDIQARLKIYDINTELKEIWL